MHPVGDCLRQRALNQASQSSQTPAKPAKTHSTNQKSDRAHAKAASERWQSPRRRAAALVDDSCVAPVDVVVCGFPSIKDA